MKILDISAADEPRPSQLPAMIAALRPALIWWLAAVILPTIGGYPGVIMITPLGWILACWVGSLYTAQSGAFGLRPHLGVAALLGAIYGIILGGLFAGIGFFAIRIEPDEVGQMIQLSLGMSLVGALVCALFSTFTTWLMRRRVTA